MSIPTAQFTPEVVEAPSDKQLRLIANLCKERQYPIEKIDIDSLTGGREGTATAVVTMLLALPKVKRPLLNDAPAPEPGYYLACVFGRDMLVNVHISKARGQWYAKAARVKDGETKVSWSYLGKRIDLTEAMPLPAEEADVLIAAMI